MSMLASLLPRMTGFGSLWRFDPVNVLLGVDAPTTAHTASPATPSTPAPAHPKTSKVHAAATRPVTDALTKIKQQQQQRKQPKRSIHDRLRSLMGDMITEDELEQRFTFGRLLGSGATSKVFAARDTVTNEQVAVKVFDKAAMIAVRRSIGADGAVVQEKAVHRVRRRLLKIVSELEIAQTLDHPNIIRYIGAYETSHRLCIVHELVDGCDLLEHLLAHGKMPEARAASVFHQLLAALQYCHNRNIYHRDLKLENVLITPDNTIKLIDFGLSEATAPGATLHSICGTPLYCSPEVLFLHATQSRRQQGVYGAPADVWSVGVLMFALLTGCAPFDDSNVVTLREEIYRNAIAYPLHLSHDVKALLQSVLVVDAQLRPTLNEMRAYRWFQQSSMNTTPAAVGAKEATTEVLKRTRSLSIATDTTASSSDS